ncbi:MAG TPA: methyltransferase domain-containing protein [Chloroflexi bacterium]|jgi:SAM-dependent methyltransferase|nr:methyltransferase domain-containing protein [Chloroflexota bacterium]
MKHEDHVRLLREGIEAPDPDGVWADFGSGQGAFTLALADLLGPGATIYSIDRDARALDDQRALMRSRFPDTTVHYIVANFIHPLDLPPLDGIIMANALHFVRDKDETVRLLRRYLRPPEKDDPSGRMILVEYNVDQGNTWVPYPLAYPTWEALSLRCGFRHTRRLATVPSRFLREIYSALSLL